MLLIIKFDMAISERNVNTNKNCNTQQAILQLEGAVPTVTPTEIFFWRGFMRISALFFSGFFYF